VPALACGFLAQPINDLWIPKFDDSLTERRNLAVTRDNQFVHAFEQMRLAWRSDRRSISAVRGEMAYLEGKRRNSLMGH
jgi:hypothetical protein